MYDKREDRKVNALITILNFFLKIFDLHHLEDSELSLISLNHYASMCLFIPIMFFLSVYHILFFVFLGGDEVKRIIGSVLTVILAFQHISCFIVQISCRGKCNVFRILGLDKYQFLIFWLLMTAVVYNAAFSVFTNPYFVFIIFAINFYQIGAKVRSFRTFSFISGAIQLGVSVYVVVDARNYYENTFSLKKVSDFFEFLIVITAVSVVSTVLYVYKERKDRKTQKTVNHVLESISNLDFSSKEMRNIIDRSGGGLSSKLSVDIRKIVNIIVEYKKYLPVSLYKNEVLLFNNLAATKNSSSTLKAENGSFAGEPCADSSSCEFLETINDGLIGGNVTILVCDITNFDEVQKSYREKDLKEFLSSYIEKVDVIVEKRGGCVMNYNGTRVVCSFNSIKKSITHQKKACITSLELCQVFRKILSPDLRFQCVITSGFCRFGSVGCESIRRFNHIGEPSLRNELFQILRISNEISGMTYNPVIIDENVFQSTKFDFSSIIYDCVDILQGRVIVRLLGGKIPRNSNDEWMYVLGKSAFDSDKPKELYERAWESYCGKKRKVAEEMVEKVGKMLNWGEKGKGKPQRKSSRRMIPFYYFHKNLEERLKKRK